MQFNSLRFLIFFPVVLIVYFFIPKKLRHIWLLIASYFFYMSWNPAYAALIGFSTLLTYACGRVIGSLREPGPADAAGETKGQRGLAKAVLIFCLADNLLILFVFKYFNFGAELFDRVTGLFGASPAGFRLDLLLPVGISFYTFQALGYVTDVYRGDTPAQKDFLRYALFVSFFPQLVAGPIERSGSLMKQIDGIAAAQLWDHERTVRGFSVMLWGYFMKMVIADRAAVVANTVFSEYWRSDSFALCCGILAFALQIYCDFAGYSSIAAGSAMIMGFRLMDNFNTPYFAGSVREFWQRWHISLSTWFRDYVYIPLGGNRRGRARKHLNTFITFVLSGLWHGASLNFVIWGALHGFYQIFGDLTKKGREKLISRLRINTGTKAYGLLRTLITFALTCFAWIFFRAEDPSSAFTIAARLFTRPDPWSLTDGSIYRLGLSRQQMNILIISAAVLLIVDLLRRIKGKRPEEITDGQNAIVRPLVLLALLFAVIVFGAYGMDFDPQKFIYFQF